MRIKQSSVDDKKILSNLKYFLKILTQIIR